MFFGSKKNNERNTDRHDNQSKSSSNYTKSPVRNLLGLGKEFDDEEVEMLLWLGMFDGDYRD